MHVCRCLFRSFKRAAGVHQILQRVCRRGRKRGEGRREGGGKIPPLSLRNNSHQAERAPTPGQSSVLHTLQDTHRLQPNTLQSSSFIFIFIKSIIDMIFDTCSQCIVFSLVVSKMIIFNLKTTLLIQNLSSVQMNRLGLFRLASLIAFWILGTYFFR